MITQTYTLLNNILLPASGTVYSIPIPLGAMEGSCSLFIRSNYASTSGTISIVFELSNDNINWAQEATLSDLLSSFTKTSGPASDGKIFIPFTVTVASWLRIKFTETGAANPAQITAVLGVV